MTLFEYLSVGYSIVLSLAVLRLLGGIPAALDRQRRYWVHVLWLAYVLVRTVFYWWNFWAYREVEWSFFSFVLVLGLPGLLYMMAIALVPNDSDDVPSWRDHYFAARRLLFSSFALSLVLQITMTILLQNAPLVHPFRIIQLGMIGLAVIGVFSTDHRTHARLAILPVILIPATLILYQQPGNYFQQPGTLPISP